MTSKYFILVIVMVACEAKIEIPGLEDLPKCARADKDCIFTNVNKIIKAISKPFKKYGIEGFDPITLSPFDVPKPTNSHTQFFNVTITGLGDTKILGGTLEEENGQEIMRGTYEHNFKFAAEAKVFFHIDPEVSHEGPITLHFSGLRSTFTFAVKVVEKDGQKYLKLGHVTLVSVEMPNAPDVNQDEADAFLNHPAAKEFVQNLNGTLREYQQDLVEKTVKGFQTQFFEATMKFYNHVPVFFLLSDLKKSD